MRGASFLILPRYRGIIVVIVQPALTNSVGSGLDLYPADSEDLPVNRVIGQKRGADGNLLGVHVDLQVVELGSEEDDE